MPCYTCLSSVTLQVIEREISASGPLTHAAQFLADYEISDHEISGFNQTSGSNIRTIESCLVQSNSFVVSNDDEAITTQHTIDLTIDLEAEDQPAAILVGKSIVALYEISPEYLSGYNLVAGTKFSHIELVRSSLKDITAHGA